jgi:hypothetical protein
MGLAVWLTRSAGWSGLMPLLEPVGVWTLSLAGAAVLLVFGVVVCLRMDAE